MRNYRDINKTFTNLKSLRLQEGYFPNCSQQFKECLPNLSLLIIDHLRNSTGFSLISKMPSLKQVMFTDGWYQFQSIHQAFHLVKSNPQLSYVDFCFRITIVGDVGVEDGLSQCFHLDFRTYIPNNDTLAEYDIPWERITLFASTF